MHGRWCRSYANRFAQEGGFLGVALDQMDMGAGRIRQRASEHDARKATAAAEVDPDFCRMRQAEKLERIGNVTRPEIRKCRWRDEVGLGLPRHQEIDIAIEPRLG